MIGNIAFIIALGVGSGFIIVLIMWVNDLSQRVKNLEGKNDV